MWLKIILLVIMAVFAITDYRERKAPNKIIFPAIGFVLISQSLLQNFNYIFTGVFVLIISYLLFCFNIIGAGDGKMLFLSGLILGNEIRNMIIVAIAVLIVMIIYYKIKEVKTKEKQIIPLAIAFFIGTLVTVIGG